MASFVGTNDFSAEILGKSRYYFSIFLRKRMTKLWISFSIAVLLLTGCAQKELSQNAPELPQKVEDEKKELRAHIVANAMKHKNRQDGGDCSGFVTLVNKESNEPFFQTQALNDYYEDSRKSLAIYNYLADRNRLYYENPKVGDLVFFANTVKAYARTKDTDNITHIGIITRIDADETVYFIHHTKGKNLIGQMNLKYPDASLYEHKVVNSYMEKCAAKNSQNKCLAPEYFSAYGKIQ